MRISDWSSDVCSSDLGGARGRAQIGVIEALEARGLRISSVAGSSSGALVGGVYAAGKLREFREGFEKLTRGQFLRLLDPVVGRPGMIGGQRLVDAMSEVVGDPRIRSEEHTSELQSLMRHSYALFCLQKQRNGMILE